MRERHVIEPGTRDRCGACGQPWPCQTLRLLAERDALLARCAAAEDYRRRWQEQGRITDEINADAWALSDEVRRLRALLAECAAVIGPPGDHRPDSDDGLHALAVKLRATLPDAG